MPVWLDTRGKPVISIAICSRCSRKFPWVDLQPDPNFPGLMVCKDDLDELDPYRLPARQAENIALPWTRPDTSIATDPLGLVTENDNNFIVTEDYVYYLVP